MGNILDSGHHDFNKAFGKSWKDFFDITFLRILSTVLLFTFTAIVYLGTKEYPKFSESFENILQQKYIEILKRTREVRIDFPEEKKIEITKAITTSSKIIIKDFRPDRIQQEINSKDLIDNQKILDIPGTGKNIYSNFPDLSFDDIEITDALIAVKNKSSHGGLLKKIPIIPNNPNIDMDDTFNPWDYKLKRVGNLYLEPTADMIEEKEKITGWRDQDEISISMQKRERMVEYCFRREAKNYSDLQGYVSVRFIILHTGTVDPASVQIIESTLFNKRIEMCIKNVFKRYRGFESLDESMGRVAVVQKFIFN